MVASDLRVGNLIYSKQYDGTYKIVEVSPYTIVDFANNPETDKYKPIPLSIDLLKKSELNYSDKDWVGEPDNTFYSNKPHQGTLYISFNKDGNISIRITYAVGAWGGRSSWGYESLSVFYGEEYYMHQMQNSFKALTSEELEIKLLSPAC